LNIVNPAALITVLSTPSVSIPQGQTVSAFTPVTASGGYETLTYAIAPSLPSGLTFSSSNGQITGTPSIYTTVTNYTVTVNDQAAQTSSRTFSLVVTPPALTATLVIPSSTFIRGVTITSIQ
jgi:hypothetical protein